MRVKRSFDPSGVLNPGVKISDRPFTDHIDYTRLSKSCATCAKCNAVCPVYDVFRSEDMSSRGWFEIVTDKNYSYLNSKRVVEACLNCKSCRTACPAGVDVSQLILDKRAENPNQLAGVIFKLHAQTDRFEKYIKLLARSQAIWSRPFVRRALDLITRPILRHLAATATLSPDIVIPKLAVRHLRDRYAHLVPLEQRRRSPVAYFHGCAANYFDDGVGDAVIGVLRKHGVEPDLPPQRCSGTPIETYGYRELAKEGARVNLRSLTGYDRIVTGCASCTLMLKDYPKLFAGEPEQQAAEVLATRVWHITEFVAQSSIKPPMAQTASTSRTITYHSSCHLRAAGVTKEPRSVLRDLPGVKYVEMADADRCAGGAGTYLVKDFDTSQRIMERKRCAIEASHADVVATSCPACMIQLKTGLRGKASVKHVAQLLEEAYEAAERKTAVRGA